MTICPNLSDDQVKLAFSKFDTSGDDKLDYREFCEMIKQKVGEGVRMVLFIILTQFILQYSIRLYVLMQYSECTKSYVTYQVSTFRRWRGMAKADS